MYQIHPADIERLVDIIVVDCKHGHNPSLYKRGKNWRYHLDRYGTNWEDAINPVSAALLTQGRDYNIFEEVKKLSWN